MTSQIRALQQFLSWGAVCFTKRFENFVRYRPCALRTMKMLTSVQLISQVYHHASILMLSEYATTYGNWPAISVPLGLNGVIHVFLYFYYGQAALYPGQRPAWKKNLTQLQLIQFMIGLCHMIVGYLHHGWCYYGILYELTMIWLFSNFYYQAYHKERATIKKLE